MVQRQPLATLNAAEVELIGYIEAMVMEGFFGARLNIVGRLPRSQGKGHRGMASEAFAGCGWLPNPAHVGVVNLEKQVGAGAVLSHGRGTLEKAVGLVLAISGM